MSAFLDNYRNPAPGGGGLSSWGLHRVITSRANRRVVVSRARGAKDFSSEIFNCRRGPSARVVLLVKKPRSRLINPVWGYSTAAARSGTRFGTSPGPTATPLSAILGSEPHRAANLRSRCTAPPGGVRCPLRLRQAHRAATGQAWHHNVSYRA